MADRGERILVWLPSPLGDAILSTPALRALRRARPEAHITLCGPEPVHAALQPCPEADHWLDLPGGLLPRVRHLRRGDFDSVVLFKNSFGSAWTCRLARISRRLGYAREARGWLLTDRITPPRRPDGSYRPAPMVDYYLNLVARLGARTDDRSLSVSVDPGVAADLRAQRPELFAGNGPRVVLVPGGGFGPSKCWAPERFAALAEALYHRTGARSVVSVAPNPTEQAIGRAIVAACNSPLVNLGDAPLPLTELKVLIAAADLVVTNDTGPRHLAIALQRPVITLFGPNDPAWTQTGWQHETQLVGRAPCVPCQQPVCRAESHLCMDSITVDEVCAAAEALLDAPA